MSIYQFTEKEGYEKDNLEGIVTDYTVKVLGYKTISMSTCVKASLDI